ncbi:MAG: efflux RND transporter periplasmic adaptor subunit [Armatimonadota bacterium]
MRSGIVAVSLGALLLVGGLGWLGGKGRPAAADRGEEANQLVVTTAARKADLLLTVAETGVIAAKRATPVVPEISGRVKWVSANGVVVSAGEVILRLDPTRFEEQLKELQARYDDAVRAQAQADAAGKARMKETQLRLQRAEDEVVAFERQQQATLQQQADAIAFAEAELKYRREDAEVKRRLAAKGLVPGTDVERAEAAVKAAEFSLDRSRSDYELKKTQAESDAVDRRQSANNTRRDLSRARTWSEREMRMSGNEVENLTLELARAKEDLTRTTITAPVSGLLVLSSQGGWHGDSNLPKAGSWISQGREFAQIISLDRMQVKLELNQAEIAGVKMGQTAEVAVEALRGSVLKGKVTAIGQTARRPPVQGWMGMSSTATFPMTIDLPPTGNALIRPGMRASVRIVYRRIKGAIIVPSGCIFRRDGKSIVFVRRNGRFTAVQVTVGESNGDYTAITKGLRAGEQIALNDLGSPASTAAGASGRPKEPVR